MDAKKKKIRILSCIAALIVVAAVAVTVFAIIKYTRKNNNNVPEPVEPQTEFSLYTQAITEGVVPKNYKGIYRFSSVSSVEFNLKTDEYPLNDYRNQKRLSEDDIYSFYHANNIRNKTDLLIDLLKQKTDKVNNDDEYLSFDISALGTKSYFNVLKGTTALAGDENKGTFTGDDDVIMVTTRSGDVFFASFKYRSILYDSDKNLILNDETQIDYQKLYVSKNVYSKNGTYLLFTVTYEYELCRDSKRRFGILKINKKTMHFCIVFYFIKFQVFCGRFFQNLCRFPCHVEFRMKHRRW